MLLLAALCWTVIATSHISFISPLCVTHSWLTEPRKIPRGKCHSSALLLESGCSFIFMYCVWECVWQECHPPRWFLSQTVEYLTPNRTTNLSRATNGCHTSAKRASTPLNQLQQVGALLPCPHFYFPSESYLNETMSVQQWYWTYSPWAKSGLRSGVPPTSF